MSYERKKLAIPVVLALVAFAVFYRMLGHSLLMNWDDYDYLVNNEMIRGITWPHIKRAFSESYFVNYAPMHMVSYMVDYAIFGGLKPAGFFLVNLLLHIANGILLYYLVLKVFGSRVVAGVAGFIFLVHPVQVESVAWLSQRKNVLSMLFFLVSFYCYICHAGTVRSRRLLFYGCSLLAFTLALLSKSAAVVLPPILLLYDLCFLNRETRGRWILNKVPFGIAAALVSVATIKSQAGMIQDGREAFFAGGPLDVFYTMLTILPRYLELLFFPTGLSAMYMPQVRTSFDAVVAGSAVLLVLLIILGVMLYRRERGAFFWYAIFFVSLLPVSQIIPLPTLMNDRYLYFPLVGAAVLFGILVERLVERRSIVAYGSTLAILALALLALPVISWQRVGVWRNDISLWQDATAKVPEMPFAWASLGASYQEAGRREEALAAYRRALDIDPKFHNALNNIGGLYNEMGRLDQARPYLLRVVQLFPGNFKGYMNLGINYFRSGDFDEAEPVFLKALQLNRNLPDAKYALGSICLSSNRLAEARVYFASLLAEVGSDPELEYQLALVEARSGKPREAVGYLEKAVRNGGTRYLEQARAEPSLAPLLAGR